jgi:DNA-binding GntR family transcriptional regulator
VAEEKQHVSLAEVVAIDRVETLTERAYAQLRESLMAGTFSPGQRITIRTIAAALGISPTPAREALGRLVAERALEFGANRTVFLPKLTPEKVREIYKLRLALETMAAEAAVPVFNDEKCAYLERQQLAIGAAMDRKDYKAVLIENEKFHFSLYRASGLPLVCQMIESLWLQIGPSLNLLYPEFDLTRQGVNAHHAMIRGLKKKDVAAVIAAVVQDLDGGEKRLLRVVTANS